MRTLLGDRILSSAPTVVKGKTSRRPFSSDWPTWMRIIPHGQFRLRTYAADPERPSSLHLCRGLQQLLCLCINTAHIGTVCEVLRARILLHVVQQADGIPVLARSLGGVACHTKRCA